jgi:hypothetical protein
MTVIVAQSNTTLESDQGKALIEHLRADAPAVSQGLDIRVGGLPALSLDLDSALYRNFPGRSSSFLRQHILCCS